MIRMTRQADYGTVLLTFFAAAEGSQTLTARDVSQRARLPLPTVTKILKLLARGGVLVSYRGVKGGYGLARRPDEITIADVITALDGPIAMTHCSANADGCRKEGACPARPSWQRIDHVVRDVLAEITLSDLVDNASDRACSGDGPLEFTRASPLLRQKNPGLGQDKNPGLGQDRPPSRPLGALAASAGRPRGGLT